MEFIIEGALLAFRDGLFPGRVRVVGQRIVEVIRGAGSGGSPAFGSPTWSGQPDGVRVVDARGLILSSGFIDLHCHGGANADTNDGSEEALEMVGAFHRSHGITAFTPSLSVDPVPVLEKALEIVRSAKKTWQAGRPEILGAHFESPWINPRYKGCQAEERLLPFDANALALIRSNADTIARITVAPELPGVMEAIPLLRSWGLVISGGHSDADAVTVHSAADRGMTLVTHLYNAMSSVHKTGPFRVPGFLEAALTDDRLFTEVICDGRHVPPELITIARRCKGLDRFLVCSDASRAAGMSGEGPYYVCGQEVIVEGGVAMLKDRSSLASSATALDGMVRVLVRDAHLPVHEALYAASAVPAAAIGVAHRKGSLSPGYDADLVLLDGESNVVAVWCRGEGGFLPDNSP